MVKSKFPGKPSRLVQRTLVSAFSVTVPSYDTSAIAENVCYGLSVFENTFGNEEDDADFVGFSNEEIESSLMKKAEFMCDVREKFLARGLTCSSSFDKKHVDLSDEEKDKPSAMRLVIALKPEIVSQYPNDPKKERRKCSKFWFVSKKINNQHHSRHGFKSLNKSSLLRFKHKPLTSNYLSDKFRRKLGVQSRNVHSSRLLKSTKRFLESEKRNQKSTKQFLRNNKLFRNDVEDVIMDDDKAKLEVSSSKVIIREARLNISTEAAKGIEGPFSVRKSISNRDSNDSSKEITRKEKASEKERNVLRGPRIKHVCRSASSVLRTSLENLSEFDNDDLLNGLSPGEISKLLPRNGHSDSKMERGSQLNRIRQCGDNNVTSNDLQNDELSQYQGARCLQDLIKESSDESEESENKSISTDFWEAYDPDEVCKTGFPLIFSEPLNVRALCFLCGSAGREKLLYCVACCEPYHWYCAEGPSMFREEAELEKCRANWICRKCKVCSTCGKRGDLRSMSSCKRCKNSYHVECLSNKVSKKNSFPSDRPWLCPSCLRCKSCNSNTVVTHVGNIPLCLPCFKLRQKGNYCPLCQGCYQDEDYNVQMMECGMCKCWIHAKCEGISSEKYQILSFLPESVEFVCRLCCSVSPAQWRLAVEDELKAGFYGVLKSLCNNKKVGDLLKESPRKEVSPCSCDKRDGVTAKASITDIEQNLHSPLAHCKRALNFNVNNEAVVARTFGCDDVSPPTPLQKCSSCYCNGVKIRNSISERLLAMKANVSANRYASVFSFDQQLENLLDELEEGSQETKTKYRELRKSFFPWFDAEHAAQQDEVLNNSIKTVDSKEKDSSTLNCNDDPASQEVDDFAELREKISTDEHECEERFRKDDIRVCIFCKGKGDAIATEGGRLIYCGRNEWVHSNCAMWSAEVFEEIDGSLQNVHSAISRGRQIRCSICKEKGASVGCCYKNCGLTYHFVCARKAQCTFLQNKTIYCRSHDLKQHNLQELENEKDFEILRPVYVEMDRKKKKLDCHSNVELRIGSLHVVSLGRIDPHLSDQPQYILPVNYICKRLFWSTKTPWRIVEYNIQIKVSYSCQESNDADINYTIDHSVMLQEVVKKPVDCTPRSPCCLTSDIPKIIEKPLPSNQNKSKRKIDFNHSSPTSNPRKKFRENGYLSAARLGHVVIDYQVSSSMVKKLVQLDGMIDMFADEEPVTCAQCQRTYRTTYSYERHLDTCNADFGDFMISSCESDSVSSEEDKICGFGNSLKKTSPMENSLMTEMASVDVSTFVDKCADTYIIANDEKSTTGIPSYANNIASNINVNSTAFYPCAAMTYEDAQLMNNAHTLSNTTVTLVQNVKQGDTVGVVPAPQPITLAPTLTTQPTIKFNLVDHGNKITNYNTQFTPQSYSIQNITSTPTYIIHQPQYQKPAMTEVIPTFLAVDNSSQPLQQIQLQPFQPTVVPTILGTAIVQPNLIDTAAPTTTYIVNAPSTPTVDLYRAQPQNVILPSPQPILFGMETMVSNTVMSSSHQFMAQSLGAGGNIGSSTLYSTTTTQVFQAAKQLPSPAQQPDLTSGYIVLNTPTVPPTPNSIQTIQTAPATLQEVQQRVEPPQMTVVSDSPAKYMYVQFSDDCCATVSQTTPPKKLPPVIVKPAIKKLLPDKKNTKVMKVWNNRPIAIQTADNIIPLNANQVNKTAKEMTMMSTVPNVKNLQIKTTDRALLCKNSGSDVVKIAQKRFLYSNGGEAKGPDENNSIKCAPAAVNGRSKAGLSCLLVDAPKVAKVADSGPLPISISVCGATKVVDKSSSCSEKIMVNMPQASASVTDLEKRDKSMNLTPKESKIQEGKKNEPIKSPALENKTTTVLNGRKVVGCGFSMPTNTSSVPRDTRKEDFPPVLNGKRLPSFSKLPSCILPNLPEKKGPVVLNGRNLNTHLPQTPTTKVVEEEKSAPSMPILDFQMDELNVQNEEFPSTSTSAPSPVISDPVRKECVPKSPVCNTPESQTSSKNMPLLESPTQSTSISETDRIFDELVRQHKQMLARKAAAAKEKLSLAENVVTPTKSSDDVANLDVTKETNDKIVENKSKKRSPIPKTAGEEEGGKSTVENKTWKTASISYEVKAEDGFTYKTNDLHDLWKKILESVQHSRNEHKLPLLPKNALVNGESVYSLLGLENNASKYLLEQLPDAWKCIFYKPVFHKTPIYGRTSCPVENVSGCARTEPFTNSHKFDMFGWLASRHRKPPRFILVSDSDIVNGNRRIASVNLPMAMRFRHLKETAKITVGVFRSDIHGRGLFCLRDIDAGEMVVEYAGEVIRSTLTDKREKYYTSKGIGCYMFRIDDKYVVDATMCGNAARFINHSCDPNCYSRIVDILGKKHILIFALRRIIKGEELTYDYKFPLEEDKIHCHCLARKCRKYLN